MESAGLRTHSRATASSARLAREALNDSVEPETPSIAVDSSDGSTIRFDSAIPPKFDINLSLPPQQRYLEVADHFRDEARTLPHLFDELIHDFFPRAFQKPAQTAARLFMRRVYDTEENEEIRGISTATGIPMHLLVALNSLLDALTGCTSGGARVVDASSQLEDANAPLDFRILHFRTLDWGMDPLRKIVVELNYVTEPGGDPVARCLTYFGYVGVLTGVRKGLSLSLNFRPHHDRSTLIKRLRFRWHQLMVLTGRRRSISSVLRQALLRPIPADAGEKVDGAATDDAQFAEQVLPGLVNCQSTAAYLIFCTPGQIISVEKDNGKGSVASSSTFQVTLNHDLADETEDSRLDETVKEKQTQLDVTGMAEIVDYSIERKGCAHELWETDMNHLRTDRGIDVEAVEEGDVISWVSAFRGVTNDETHYSVVMDPQEGTILWRSLWLEPMSSLYESDSDDHVVETHSDDERQRELESPADEERSVLRRRR